MRDRSAAPVARAGRSPASASLDLVCCSAAGRDLAVLVHAGTRGGAASLPWVSLASGAHLDATADAETTQRRMRAALAGRGIPVA